MRQYLLNIHMPDGPPPPPEVLEPVMRNVHKLNEEMRDAGAWVFAGGLHPPSASTVLRSTGGDVLITDGPYTEGKEHIGGFTVIRAPDLDAALAWARRLAQVLTPLSIEVRPFHDEAED